MLFSFHSIYKCTLQKIVFSFKKKIEKNINLYIFDINKIHFTYSISLFNYLLKILYLIEHEYNSNIMTLLH
jgi:hypothetical protein